MSELRKLRQGNKVVDPAFGLKALSFRSHAVDHCTKLHLYRGGQKQAYSCKCAKHVSLFIYYSCIIIYYYIVYFYDSYKPTFAHPYVLRLENTNTETFFINFLLLNIEVIMKIFNNLLILFLKENVLVPVA